MKKIIEMYYNLAIYLNFFIKLFIMFSKFPETRINFIFSKYSHVEFNFKHVHKALNKFKTRIKSITP